MTAFPLRSSIPVLGLALLVLFTVPSTTSAQSGAWVSAESSSDTAPAESAHEDRPRRRRSVGLLIAGPVMLAVPWILNGVGGLFAGVHACIFCYSGSSSDAPGWDVFRVMGFVPIAGPWIQLALKPTDFYEDAWGAWLIVDGVLQATGLALLIAGLTVGTEGDEEPSVMVLPNIGPDGAGLRVAGRF